MADQQPGLFSRLTRLFSTDVIIRNVGGNQLKVVDVDKIQAYGNVKTNALIDTTACAYLTDENATESIFSGIATMNSDAGEPWHVQNFR